LAEHRLAAKCCPWVVTALEGPVCVGSRLERDEPKLIDLCRFRKDLQTRREPWAVGRGPWAVGRGPT